MALLGALARLIDLLFDALMLVLVINALLSWIQPKPFNPVVQFLESVSDTVCNPIRRTIPTVFGGFDLSPMIAMVLLMVLKGIVMRVLLG